MAFVIGKDSLAQTSEADAYFLGRTQGEKWAPLTSTIKDNAMRMAYRHLRGLYDWRQDVTVYPANSTTFWWPSIRPSIEIPTDQVPEEEKWAQFELAYQWAFADQLMPAATYLTSVDPDAGQQLKSKKLGPLQKEYYENVSLMFSMAEGRMKSKVYPLIDLYLQDFVYGRIDSGQIQLVI